MTKQEARRHIRANTRAAELSNRRQGISLRVLGYKARKAMRGV